MGTDSAGAQRAEADQSSAARADDSVRLQLAREAPGLGMWELDIATGEVTWDEQCARLMGTSLAEYDGTVEGYERLIHPDDLEAVRTKVQTAIETSCRLDLSYRSRSQEGEVRHLLSRGAILPDAEGRPCRLVGAVVDATALTEAEIARAEELLRMRSLVTVAQELGGAGGVDDILQVLATHGTSMLDTDGIVLALCEEGASSAQVFTTAYFDPEVQQRYAEVPLDLPIPLTSTLREGRTHFFASRAATVEAFPDSGAVAEEAGAEAVCSIPLRSEDRLIGAFAVAWPHPRTFSERDQELLTAFAAQTAQALGRIQARAAEQAAIAEQLNLGATLQRSLLTTPPQLPGLRIAVRYQPAAAEAQVGGDWYDAFGLPGGATALVVGDVTGHDQNAAATMGQLRNLLRGVSHSRPSGPAETFRVLEEALDGLEVEVLATAVLAHLHPHPAGARLRWANAGHPPPILLVPEQPWQLLESESDLLLGLQPGVERREHERIIPTGSTLLLYTDGIAERRGESLDEGIRRLGEVLDRLCAEGHCGDAEDLEGLCDQLLAAFAEHTLDDDVAILALRVGTLTTAPTPTSRELDPGTLRPEPASVGRGRSLVEAMCSDHHVAPEVSDTAVLLTSELLTNAVLHGRSAVGLRIHIDTSCVRVEVRDDNDRPPRVDHPDSGALSGRGMWLVEALASRWGVRGEAAGKTVWVEVDR